MSEKQVFIREDLDKILDDIEIAQSFVHAVPEIGWDIQPVEEPSVEPGRIGQRVTKGWLINLHYTRPDTFTGVPGQGVGRKEWIPVGATESYVVKTTWVLLDMLVHHELMEAFMWKGKRPFNPHHSIEDLWGLAYRWEQKR